MNTSTDIDSTVAAFQRDGFCRLDDILSPADFTRLDRIYEACFSRDDIARKTLGGVVDGKDVLPQVLGPERWYPELLELDLQRTLASWAERLLGPEARYRSSHMIRKPGSYGAATPWHQDQAYHPGDQRFRNVNFWIPLDGASEAEGCLHFVPGTHGGTVVPHRVIDTPQGRATEALGSDYWAANGVPVPCPPGSCSAHHSYMLHYAGPNTTGRDRRAYTAVFTCPSQPLERPLHMPWKEAL